MKRIIRNREDDTQAEGLKDVSGTISAPNWEIQTKPACYIHLCVVSSPHCGGDYHKNSNAPLRPATLCASQASHFWKERRMKEGEEQENKRDSAYVFPFSWAFRALVTHSLSFILHHHLLWKRALFGELNSFGMSANQNAGSRECVVGRPASPRTL